MKTRTSYDVVVIGAGSGGITAALGLSKIGRSVLLVSETIGGECTQSGCVPSKALLRFAREVSAIADPAERSRQATQALERVRQMIARIEAHDQNLFADLEHCTFVQGRAQFVDPHTVRITPAASHDSHDFHDSHDSHDSSDAGKSTESRGSDEFEVSVTRAVIATGSLPRVIPIDGLPEQMLLTNETIFQLADVPRHLVIVGGGPIGVELATAFAGLGSAVTMVIRSELLSGEQPEIVAPVRQSLEEAGVKIYEGIDSQSYDTDGQELVLHKKNANETVSVKNIDKVLMAIGRVPNVEGLGLFEAGVAYGKQGIIVSTSLQTNKKHIVAIGDVTTEPKFTHLADNHARFIVEKTLMPWKRRSIVPVPAVTFSHPPVGHVGSVPMPHEVSTDGVLSTDPLVRRFVVEFSQTDRGQIEEATGLVGVFAVHMLSGRLRGVSLVGEFAEHALPFFSLMMARKVPVFFLGSFMTPYPTYMNGVQSLYKQFLTAFLADLRANLWTVLVQQRFRILAATFWLLVAGGLFWYLQSIAFDLELLVQELFELFSSPFGVALFFGVYALRAMISFPATALSVLSGVVYGFWGGMILTILASNMSSAVAYLLGQTVFGQSTTTPGGMDGGSGKHHGKKGRSDQSNDSGIRSYIRKNTFEAVLILRLTAAPYDLISYIAGAIRAPFWQFLCATAIGALPGSIAIVSFGASLENVTDFDQFSIDPVFLVLGIGLMVVSIVVSQVVRRWRSSTPPVDSV